VNLPAFAFDANNIASVQAAMAVPTMIETEQNDEVQILNEIIQKSVRLLKENKTAAEIKNLIGESYENIPHVDALIQRAQAEYITNLKREVEMVLEDVPDCKLPETVEGAEPEEQIRVLKENLDVLYDAVANKLPPDEGPKFGKLDGPILGFQIEGQVGVDGLAFLDADGMNIYDGTSVKLEPWMQEMFAETWLKEEKRAKKQAQIYDGDDEYPVRILPPGPGPHWNDKILYGVSGDIVRKISQHCESHPAGMLVDFLVSFGSILGRGPYFSINSTKHYTNEFMIRVGDSSKSRKGTGRDAIDDVLKVIDPKWYSERVTSGFGSAEAVISQIKDSSMETRLVKGVSTPHLVRGVDDKRLCIRESEIASIFVLAAKRESMADVVFREAWDGKPLRNIVKGKTSEGLSNSAKCEEPHLSISGDTTVHELRVKMPKGADENGFGNRFLFVYVSRVKECPNGGPTLDWSKEIAQLYSTLQWAKTIKHVNMTSAARKWWFDNYHSLEEDGPQGQAGKMTARAPAHLRRIAMIYALLDKSDQIDTIHFQAALRLWNYCSESAAFIFGGATAEQLRIQNWIGIRQTATYQQVRDELYQRNKPCGEIKADLALLVSKRMLSLAGDVYSKKGG
jgi:hypothetical protein